MEALGKIGSLGNVPEGAPALNVLMQTLQKDLAGLRQQEYPTTGKPDVVGQAYPLCEMVEFPGHFLPKPIGNEPLVTPTAFFADLGFDPDLSDPLLSSAPTYTLARTPGQQRSGPANVVSSHHGPLDGSARIILQPEAQGVERTGYEYIIIKDTSSDRKPEDPPVWRAYVRTFREFG